MLFSNGDNIAVTIDHIAAGDWIQCENKNAVLASENISRGHKVLVKSLKAGEPIIKRGQIIARAKFSIPAGRVVDLHNIFTNDCAGKGYTSEDPRPTYSQTFQLV